MAAGDEDEVVDPIYAERRGRRREAEEKADFDDNLDSHQFLRAFSKEAKRKNMDPMELIKWFALWHEGVVKVHETVLVLDAKLQQGVVRRWKESDLREVRQQMADVEKSEEMFAQMVRKRDFAENVPEEVISDRDHVWAELGEEASILLIFLEEDKEREMFWGNRLGTWATAWRHLLESDLTHSHKLRAEMIEQISKNHAMAMKLLDPSTHSLFLLDSSLSVEYLGMARLERELGPYRWAHLGLGYASLMVEVENSVEGYRIAKKCRDNPMFPEELLQSATWVMDMALDDCDDTRDRKLRALCKQKKEPFRRFFSTVDVDGDGSVDFHEFDAAIRDSGAHNAEVKRVSKMTFREMDVDESGSVTAVDLSESYPLDRLGELDSFLDLLSPPAEQMGVVEPDGASANAYSIFGMVFVLIVLSGVYLTANFWTKIWRRTAIARGKKGLKKATTRVHGESRLTAGVAAAGSDAVPLLRGKKKIPVKHLFLKGRKYHIGEEVEQNLDEAVRLIREAAHRGYPVAQHALGLMCEKGEGLAKSQEDARYWFGLASRAGLAEAQFCLGYLDYAPLLSEPHLPTNQPTDRSPGQRDTEAVIQFRLAAAQGHNGARSYLAHCFLLGRGVERDFAEARRLFSISAQSGNNMAHFMLGEIFRCGIGCTVDFARAKWHYQACQAPKVESFARSLLGKAQRKQLFMFDSANAVLSEIKLSCSLCQAEGDDFKLCARCKGPRYCSAKCQKADWNDHVEVCRKPEATSALAQAIIE